MFVTSDCYDLEQIAHALPYNWHEAIAAGVGCNSAAKVSAQKAAQFLTEAARAARVEKSIRSAGYTHVSETQTRTVKLQSFERTIAQKTREGSPIDAILMSGSTSTSGGASAGGTSMFVGGEIDGIANDRCLRATFVYPGSFDAAGVGSTLLKLAVQHLEADYGYYFLRDDAFLPRGYAMGAIGGLAALRVDERQELEELAAWGRLTREEYWTLSRPPLRDVYEVNLLSERHLSNLVGAVSLGAWIAGAEGRGNLERLDQRRWVWTLNSDEIQYVRIELQLSGILFSRHERVYRRG